VPEPYDRFAPHFDAWQQSFGGAYDTLILPRILGALASHRPPVRSVVDLGSGTGDLVIALARAGYTVLAIDRSAAMLDVARAKISGADLATAPTLLEQDLRTFRLARPVEAAICVYTVINQLTDHSDLARAMAAVHAALVPGGLFLFEVNLLAAYERYWRGVERVTLPDAVLTREHHAVEGGRIVEASVTICRGDGTAVHDRIAQRVYDDDEIEAALAGAGFACHGVARYDPFDPAGAPVKALWSAQRVRT